MAFRGSVLSNPAPEESLLALAERGGVIVLNHLPEARFARTVFGHYRGDSRGQVEPETALTSLGAMALEAIPLEQGADVLVEGDFLREARIISPRIFLLTRSQEQKEKDERKSQH